MDKISNVILNRADDLFKSPPSPPSSGVYPANSRDGQVLDLIIDLETPIDPQISYTSTDDILFQEEILISQPIIPEPNNTNANAAKLKTMIHSMRDQLDAMLRFINGDETKQKPL